MRLTARDVNLLIALATHHFMSAPQLRRLIFPGAKDRRVRRRLHLLFDHRLIERVAVVAQPTRGVPQFVYTLAPRGAAVLSAETGEVVRPFRLSGPRLHFVTHQLVVNEVYICLNTAAAANGWVVRSWQHEWDLKVTGPDRLARAERVTIRDPDTQTTTNVRLLPDAFLELVQAGGLSYLFFVEVDLATHKLSVWRDRALAFAAYADPSRGLFRKRFGAGRRDNFRLLIVTTNDFRKRSRRDNILATIHEAVGSSDLFLATTLSEVTPQRILGHVWRRPGTQEPISLLMNASNAAKVRVRSTSSRMTALPSAIR